MERTEMATRPDLSFPGSLTGRQWRSVEAIEARGDYVLVRRSTLEHLVLTHGQTTPGTCPQLDEARKDLERHRAEREDT